MSTQGVCLCGCVFEDPRAVVCVRVWSGRLELWAFKSGLIGIRSVRASLIMREGKACVYASVCIGC